MANCELLVRVDPYDRGLRSRKRRSPAQRRNRLRELLPYGILACMAVGTGLIWIMTHRSDADDALSLDATSQSFVESESAQESAPSDYETAINIPTSPAARNVPVLLTGHVEDAINETVSLFVPIDSDDKLLPGIPDGQFTAMDPLPLRDRSLADDSDSADDTFHPFGLRHQHDTTVDAVEFADLPSNEQLRPVRDASPTGFSGQIGVRSPARLGAPSTPTFVTRAEPAEIDSAHHDVPVRSPAAVEITEPTKARYSTRADLIHEFRKHTEPARAQLRSEALSEAAAKRKPESQTRPEISEPRTTNKTPATSDAALSATTPLLNLDQPQHGEAFWWESAMQKSLFYSGPTQQLGLEEALMTAIQMAPELQVLHADHAIAEQVVRQQEASFDWTTFLRSSWNRDDNPVGSQLDGSPNRLTQSAWSMRGGVRRTNQYGGEIELSQELGYLNSSSQFIQPNNQGTGRLSFDYSHPLLRQQGILYNTSPIALAEISREIAHDNLMAGIENHLLNVANAYWTLVLNRGRLVQNRKALDRATTLFTSMSGRKEVDVRPSQIARAESSLLQNKSMVVEADHDARRSQEALLRLIYGSSYTNQVLEVIPTTPVRYHVEISDPTPHVDDAVRNRSEIQAVLREIRAATLQKQLAANDVLPELNLVLSGYTAGLRGNTDIVGAVKNQFNTSEPGFSVGFEFEMPYRNRAAKAASAQRRIAVERFRKQFETVVADVTLDVRSQLLNVSRDTRLTRVRKDALLLTGKELDYLTTRFKLLIDGNEVSSLYFDNLVQTQQRYLSAEFSVLIARVQLAQSQMQLLRGKGMMHSLVAADIVQSTGSFQMAPNGAVGRHTDPAESVFPADTYEGAVSRPSGFSIPTTSQPGHSGTFSGQ